MKILPKLYKEYGDHLNTFRAFPSIMDGLRPVERRVLLATHDTARQKLVKSVKVIGAALVLHPHSDDSVYSTLSRLVNAGLVIGQGNWGDRCGLEQLPPAAYRYTEVKANPIIDEMLFENIKHVEWDVFEIEKEPVYIPTPFPICFVIDNINIGIGLGWQTKIPRYKISDLLQLALAMIEGKDLLIHPYCPGNEVISDDSESIKLLDTGEGTIIFKPQYEIDKKKRKIKITSVPIKGFRTLLSGLKQFFEKNLITVLDNTSNNKTEILIEVIKNKKIDFDKLVQKVEKAIIQQVSFNIIVADNNHKLHKIGVKELLKYSINNYRNVWLNKFNYELQKSMELKRKYTIIQKIRPQIAQLIKDDIYDIGKVINYITQIHTDITQEELKEILSKYTLNKLFTIKVDINEIDKQIDEWNGLINGINRFVKNNYKNLIKKLDF